MVGDDGRIVVVVKERQNYEKVFLVFDAVATKLADTGGVYGVDGRMERGGGHDSGKLDWWVYILLGGQVDIRG